MKSNIPNITVGKKANSILNICLHVSHNEETDYHPLKALLVKLDVQADLALEGSRAIHY